MTSASLVEVNAGYGRASVLKDFNMEVAPGTMLAVLGASGSGKSTLLRVLAGFLRPDSGSVRVGNAVMSSDSVWVAPQKRGIGIVPQEGALFPHLNVFDNIAFGLRGHADVSLRVAELLSLVGLDEFAKRRPQELSGGQAQRVALARALAPRPSMVLLDEPFSALDSGMRGELGKEVRQLLARLATTAILVTHDQDEALSLADEVSVLSDGRLQQQGTPEQVYAQPVNLAVARFLGEMVELPAEMVDEFTAKSELGQIAIENAFPAGSSGLVGLRPEQLSIDSSQDNGVLISKTFHGHETLAEVSLDSGLTVQVRMLGVCDLDLGQRLGVCAVGAGRMFEAN